MDGRYPWAQWMGGWVKMNRPIAEFWTLNPATVIFVLESGGQIQRTRGARDFVRHLGGMGVPVEH